MAEEQFNEIEELSDEQQVIKNEVKSKTIQLEQNMKINYKFDEVVSEQNAELNYENFEFRIFKGMHEAILIAEKPYQDVKNLEGRYTKSHIQDVRNQCYAEIVGIKLDYLGKAKDELKRLKNPSIQIPVMASSTLQENLLKRLNNNLVCSELMRTLSVEELADLYEQNKNQAEIRMMIKARAFHLFRVVKDEKVRNQALHLKGIIQAYENELMNPEHFNNLIKIENTLDYIFNQSEMYPTNLDELTDSFKGLKYRKFFS